MQTQFDLDELVRRVASASLEAHTIARIFSEPTLDSTGQDAVHVTIVLTGGDRGLSGDVALDTIVAIRQSLQKDGDQRTPIINFTNEEELASDVSFESGPSL